MADFNEETVRELNDSIRELTEVMQSAMGITGSSANTQKSFIKGMGDAASSASTLNVRNKEVATSSVNVSKANKDAAEAAYKVGESFGKLYQASKDSRDALFSFSKSMVDTSEGITKYGAAINQASGALSTGLGAFGVIGKTIGLLLVPFTKLLGVTLEYTDRIFEAKDELAKFGATGRLTAKEIAEMGARAGYSSAELGKYVKIMGSAGAGLVNLGGTVNSGVIEFAKLTEVTKEERMRLRMMGVTMNEFNQNTADYIKMQTLSGMRISDEMKRSGHLQRATREYTDNLVMLSNLTGQSVDELKKKEQAALQEREVMIANIATSVKIDQLRKSGADKEADALEKEMIARNKLIADVTKVQGDDIGKALAHRLVTGVFTESTTKVMHNFRYSLEEMEVALKQGKDISEDVNKGYSESLRDMISKNKLAFQLSKEFGDMLGINNDSMLASNLITKEGIEQAKADLTAKKLAADKEEKSRVERLESEIKTRLNMDLMASTVNTKVMPVLEKMAKEIEKLTTMLTDPKFWTDIKNGFTDFMGYLKIAGLGLLSLGGLSLMNKGGGIGGIAGATLKGSGGLVAAGASGVAIGEFINQSFEKSKGISIGSAIYDLFNPNEGKNLGLEGKGPSAGQSPAGKETSNNIDDLFNFNGGVSGNKSNFEKLDPKLKNALIGAATEYNNATGEKLQINSARRDERQNTLVGGAKNSKHLQGKAVDIQQWRDPRVDAILENHGLTNRMDNHHYEMPGARLGGSFSGPNSGYPVMLHGAETVVPTPNPSTTLLKVEGDAAADKLTSAMAGVNSDALSSIMEELYSMMEYKLTEMVDKLSTSNDLQDRLLKNQM
jgi:hypothetical protein